MRRQINGLMNKLSDQSKDSIVRSLKSIFAANSVTVATHVLKDAIMAACSHPTQVMTSLIPTYAAVVAALHCTHSIDVGAHMVEHLVLALHKSVVDASPSSGDSTTAGQSIGGGRPAQHGESLISSKLPANALLLLVYLYNLRVVHHALIVDIMKMFADCDSLNGGSDDTNSTGIGAAHLELRMELLELLINNCGSSIRSDDPDSLKLVLADLSKQYSAMQQLNDSSIQQKQPQLGLMSSTGRSAGDDSNADSTAKSGSSSSRVRFLCAALADLRSNSKSRRAQSGSAEAVRRLRKWLGSVKTSLAGGPGGQHSSSADPCLRVGLQDLLTADTRGRWWRTGAYWSGNPGDTASGAPTGAPTGEAGGTASQGKQAQKKAKTNAPHDSGKGSADAEQRQLLELAAAMHMNTATRRRIFVVLMSSQDVCDAFERLSRLALRGKEDPGGSTGAGRVLCTGARIQPILRRSREAAVRASEAEQSDVPVRVLGCLQEPHGWARGRRRGRGGSGPAAESRQLGTLAGAVGLLLPSPLNCHQADRHDRHDSACDTLPFYFCSRYV